MRDPQRKKTAVAALSVLSNATLVAAKVIFGLLMGSVSVLSEAIHSGVDLIAALIAFFAVQSSGKPADEKHPFGHGKIENISGTIEALLIFLAGAWIISEAVHKLIRPTPLRDVNWGLLVMLASSGMNLFVSKLLFKVGRETESMALQADAWHLRTDIWTSLGVFAGLLIIWVGQLLFPGVNLQWVDPVAAIAVALLIFRAAFQLTIQAGQDLLDVSLSGDEEAWIRDVILQHCPTVCGFHRLRTRKSGSIRFVEFHMLVDPEMTVAASHRITADITKTIEDRFPNSSVTIHIEPCDGSCSEICLKGCYLSEAQRQKIQHRHQAR
jgi:cation diffusion facilitator family transporter